MLIFITTRVIDWRITHGNKLMMQAQNRLNLTYSVIASARNLERQCNFVLERVGRCYTNNNFTVGNITVMVGRSHTFVYYFDKTIRSTSKGGLIHLSKPIS